MPAPLWKLLTSDAAVDEAWRRVRAGGGAPGVDGVSLDAFDAEFTPQVQALRNDLVNHVYRVQPYRAVNIPKEGGGHRRIVIPTVRDRLLQSAVAGLLVPRIEPMLHETSFAYRPGKGVQDALLAVCRLRDRGLQIVLRSDIEQFFDTVPHETLEGMLRDAGVEPDLITLIDSWLKAPLATAGGTVAVRAGLPQGIPLAPLLANLYLTPFDRAMAEAGWNLVRYADDFIVCCRDAAAAEEARGECAQSLQSIELRLNEAKTTIGSFTDGFMFLGARFQGKELIPAAPHPYEVAFGKPPSHKPRRPPSQGLPYVMMRTLYIQEQGSQLGCHGSRLVLTKRQATLLDLPAHHIDHIFIFGRISLTAAAMAFCLIRGIPVHFFASHGRYYGALRDPGRVHYDLRRNQFLLVEVKAARVALARWVVEGKIRNCLTLLSHHRRNHPETDLEKPAATLRRLLKRIPHAKGLEQARGIEGSAAAAYFQGLSKCFRTSLAFSGRTRHPPADPINSLLSFGYTLVFYNLSSYLYARGLDPAIGMFHDGGGTHLALASDLMEEFRAPIVDAFITAYVNREEIGPEDFYLGEGTPQPCLMKDEARVKFIHAFEEKMNNVLHHPDCEHEVNWRRILDLQVCRFRRYVEKQVDRYSPFIWE